MTQRPEFHEDFSRPGEVKAGTERALGLVFAAVFAIIGVVPLWGAGSVRVWALVVAAIFLAVAVLRPGLLTPLNRLWFRLGLVLHKVVTPLIMGLLFYVSVTPIGLVMRLLGKDTLRLRFDAKAKSYWIERRPPGPDPDTMRNQF